MKRTKQTTEKHSQKINKKGSVVKKKADKKEVKHTQQRGFFEVLSMKQSVFILIGLIILVGIIAFGKFITGEHLFFFKDIGSDSVNQIYPSLTHKMSLMKEGFVSKWSFYRGMGTNFYSGFPVEPYGWFRQFLDKVGYSFLGESYFVNGRFNLIFIFNYMLSGFVFFFYLKTLSVKNFSALIGSLILSFSGYMVLGSSWGFSGHIFRAVFLLFAFEQLFVKKRWYFFPFAVLFMSGNLYNLWLYSFFLLIYSIFRYLSTSWNEKFSAYLKLVGKMILFGLIGLIMNAVNITRGFMKMYFSPRISGNSSLGSNLQSGEELIDYSDHGSTMILRFFSNDIIGSGSEFNGWSNYFEAPVFYIGILSLLLFPHVFSFLNKRDKIIYGSFAGFWLLTLLVPYLRHAVLAFIGDYYRFGFDFFIPFILLFFGIKALNEADKGSKLNLYLLGIVPLVLIIVLFIPYNFTDFQGNEIRNVIEKDIRNIIIFLIIAYSCLLFLFTKKNMRVISQFGIIILLIIELSYSAHRSYDNRIPLTKTEFNKDKAGYDDGTIDAVNFLKEKDKGFYRIEKDYQSGTAEHSSLNDAWVQAYFGTTSYSSFNQLNYIKFQEKIGLIQEGDETATRWSAGFRGQPLLQTFGNVKYHLSKDPRPAFLQFGFDSIARVKNITILKNKYYLPFGFTYDKYIDEDDFNELESYMIQPQSLSNMEREFIQRGKVVEGKEILSMLNGMINEKFNSKEEYLDALKQEIGEQRTIKNEQILLKHSIIIFKRQLALLNAFVIENESNITTDELSKFTKISQNDSLITEAENFNFDIYDSMVSKLKEDTLSIESYTNSRFKGNIDLDKEKMLFLTIPYDEGWNIKVNGKDESLMRVNFGFSGIILAEGSHQIELNYIPQYSKMTAGISIFSSILFWLYLGYFIYRKRKRTKLT